MISVSDMMSHMAVQLNHALSGYDLQKVRTGVISAWSRLMAMAKWYYFHRMGSTQLYAGESTGTVDFTLSSRQVTLTGSTWPTDVVDWHIKLDHNWYPVFRRVSSTVIELWEHKHPPADLNDVTYWVQKVLYPLPSDVGDIVQMVDGRENFCSLRLDILEAHVVQEGFAWSGVLPTKYALVGDSANPGRWNLWVPIELTQDQVVQYMYVARRPTEILFRESRGTVTVSSGVATFTDAVVNETWNGALLRIGADDTSKPTGDFGDVPSADMEFDRNCIEVRVISRISSTSVRLSNPSLTIADARSYVASTHIDVADGPMTVLLQRLCEDEYGVRTVGGHTEAMVSRSRLATAFNDALASDGRMVRSKTDIGQWYGLRLEDLGYVT